MNKIIIHLSQKEQYPRKLLAFYKSVVYKKSIKILKVWKTYRIAHIYRYICICIISCYFTAQKYYFTMSSIMYVLLIGFRNSNVIKYQTQSHEIKYCGAKKLVRSRSSHRICLLSNDEMPDAAEICKCSRINPGRKINASWIYEYVEISVPANAAVRLPYEG